MRPKHLVTSLVLPAILLTVLLAAFLTLATPATPVHAGGIVNVCDEAHLRAALIGGGTVTFSCSGTITLTAEIVISADTTIDGSGQTVTISGNHAVRVFSVNAGVALNLNMLTIADGNALYGGGIRNQGGTLTISDSVFSGNSAAAGGGIHSADGALIVRNSSFSDNSASGGGGGIRCEVGTATVSGSSFIGNSATHFGGGIDNACTMSVSNSTFSGNGGGWGGGIFNGGRLTVSNTTLSDNSIRVHTSGIENSTGTVTLVNTIVAHSHCSGVITDGGGNLSYPDTSCPGINGDPKLGPLQDNGGPTRTMALLPGSAAIDAADDVICAAAPVSNRDQRGVPRPQEAHCDIGSVEQRVVSICDEAHLRAALIGGSTVIFSCSGTITLAAEIEIMADTTIDGSGQAVTISGHHAVRVFTVNSGVTFSLYELTIADGSADFGGGILNLGSTLNVSDSAFVGNGASDSGGGIHSASGVVTVRNSRFAGNSATYAGGGIRNSSGMLTVSNSTFVGNGARYGGGVMNQGMLAASGSMFSGNATLHSHGEGGGIFNRGTLDVSNCTLAGNTAHGGGGIANWNVLAVSNSTFSRNVASYGGGIANYTPGATLVRLKNTIVADSPAGGNCAGGITDGGGNLSYPDATCPGIKRDPKLGPLQDHGGPTWTMALLPGSAALDAADDAICAAAPVNNLDQRGITRPQGPHCDIGAYEAVPPRAFLPLILR